MKGLGARLGLGLVIGCGGAGPVEAKEVVGMGNPWLERPAAAGQPLALKVAASPDPAEVAEAVKPAHGLYALSSPRGLSVAVGGVLVGAGATLGAWHLYQPRLDTRCQSTEFVDCFGQGLRDGLGEALLRIGGAALAGAGVSAVYWSWAHFDGLRYAVSEPAPPGTGLPEDFFEASEAPAPQPSPPPQPAPEPQAKRPFGWRYGQKLLEPPLEPVVSYAHYQRIQPGMSYEALCEMIGRPAEERRWMRRDDRSEATYRWRNPDGSFLEVTMVNNQVKTKRNENLR